MIELLEHINLPKIHVLVVISTHTCLCTSKGPKCPYASHTVFPSVSCCTKRTIISSVNKQPTVKPSYFTIKQRHLKCSSFEILDSIFVWDPRLHLCLRSYTPFLFEILDSSFVWDPKLHFCLRSKTPFLFEILDSIFVWDPNSIFVWDPNLHFCLRS